jgi:predicted TIM-barrel enzyme
MRMQIAKCGISGVQFYPTCLALHCAAKAAIARVGFGGGRPGEAHALCGTTVGQALTLALAARGHKAGTARGVILSARGGAARWEGEGEGRIE